MLARYLLFGALIWSSAPLFAQTAQNTAVDTLVWRLFERQEDIVWTRHYAGAYDDVYAMEAVIGFDGVRCRGFATLLKSNTRFRLDGALHQQKFSFEERDAQNAICGHWKGEFSGAQLKAEWTSHDGARGAEILLTEKSPEATAGDKWLNRYIADWNGTKVSLALFRSNNDALFGSIYMEADRQTFLLKGSIDAQRRYILEAPQFGGKSAVELSGNLSQLQSTLCTWRAANGEKRTFNFVLEQSLTAEGFDYADYALGIDVLYPYLNCADCNDWLKNQANAWSARTKSAPDLGSVNAHQPAERNLFRACGWTEITCWNEDFLSGYMLFHQSWGNKNEGAAFIFDLQTSEVISLDQVFVKDFEYQKWLTDFARRESPKLSGFSNNPEFRKWLYDDGFPLISVANEGIVLSTLFHPVFGQQHLIAPFHTLKPYLKKNNPFRRMVR